MVGHTTDRGRELRERLKVKYRMNMSMFSEAVGITKATLHHIVEGDTCPTIKSRQKLARVLDPEDMRWILFND